MANRRHSFRYRELHDEEFEELVFLLAALEVPDLIKTANPDGGLDCVVLGADGTPAPRGFQAKHHTNGPNISKCLASLRDAIASYDVRHVTFCFPTNLTKGQVDRFEGKVASHDPTVKVDFWGASQLTSRLLGSDEGHRIARHIFGDEEVKKLERLVRAHQDIDTGSQVLEVLAASNDLLADDPYFRYSVAAHPADVDPPPTARGSVMSVELADESGVRHIDAFARPPAHGAGQLPEGKLVFKGEEAIAKWQEFQRSGGKLELDDVEVTLNNLPKHFKGIVDPVVRAGVVIESKPHPARLMIVEVESDAGTSSIEFEMRPAPPKEEWDHAFEGTSGGGRLTINSRWRGDLGEAKFEWGWHSEKGSTTEQLRGLQFMRAMAGNGQMRLLDGESRETLIGGPTPQTDFDENMAALTQIYEDVVALEEWVGTAIELPDEIAAEDANALHRAARLIEGSEGSWENVRFTLQPGADPIAPEGVLQVRERLALKLFGVEHDLGEVATYAADYRVAASQPAADGGTEYQLVPRDSSSKLVVRLEREKGQPEKPEQGLERR